MIEDNLAKAPNPDAQINTSVDVPQVVSARERNPLSSEVADTEREHMTETGKLLARLDVIFGEGVSLVEQLRRYRAGDRGGDANNKVPDATEAQELK